MKIAELRRLPSSLGGESIIRTTEGQDAPIEDTRSHWKRRRVLYIAGAALALIVAALAYLLMQWSDLKSTVSADRLRVVTVTKGHFIRDVAAQGTVIAAVNPTLFAIAPGTIEYLVRAGDTVTKGQPLARLDSPDLRNEYERERATLDSLNAALSRQEIEIRRQILLSKQQADLAKVAITAAEREEKRAQAAWDERVISERDYRRAIDDLDSAKLNFDHATATAALERDSLALELRTKRLERDRQALVVENLKNRVDELTVRSPVNGMVANLAQTEKARVAESAPLITVVDLTAFEIEFQVAETYAQDIKPGMTAEITLDGRAHAGIVTAISPEVRQSQVTGRVKFSGPQPPGLRQNQRAAVRIVLDERNDVVKFERGSFVDDATRALYVVRGDHAVRVPVQLGAASVAEVEVVRGLVPGDRVIVSDTRDFNDEPQVTITR
ncbi:MAG TPA: efflux RND transporter periplasmic adaptor subunit [Steroidobacteraceae bacterium]|nr:efflux RND transporter periplasmic adaptor subunit [Steroidobacteraceae bacterium]